MLSTVSALDTQGQYVCVLDSPIHVLLCLDMTADLTSADMGGLFFNRFIRYLVAKFCAAHISGEMCSHGHIESSFRAV